MKKQLILFTTISFVLVACSQEQSAQNITTSSSLHNYDFEMITLALKNHSDFPQLNANESITEEVGIGEKNYAVTYSSKTEVNSHEPTITTDPENEDIEIWTEASSADYYITLVKEWKTEEGHVKSYWKYKFIPQTNGIELVKGEDNDYKIH